jgi:hypothetical protein
MIKSTLPVAALAVVLNALALAAVDPPTHEQPPVVVKATRLGDGPILRPDMMPKDDGIWSGNLNFPCVIRVPDWVERPLGKYYLYFSAHHGSYIRLAYADHITGPWKIYEPGTLRLAEVERVNGADRTEQRHVASPDVHIDNEHRQFRMYFHYFLPKLGHKSSVAFSTDGLKFDPRPGAIAGPYLRAFPHDTAWLAIDDAGLLLQSPDGIEPFKPVSDVVKQASAGNPKTAHFRHGGLLPEPDRLGVFFSRIGDAPEHILFTQVSLKGDPAAWQATAPAPVLEPERDWEGAKAELVPSTVMGQTNVRQLRDPFVFREDGKTYLFYAVAGETGIAMAEVTMR